MFFRHAHYQKMSDFGNFLPKLKLLAFGFRSIWVNLNIDDIHIRPNTHYTWCCCNTCMDGPKDI